jgi:hypothetical protein
MKFWIFTLMAAAALPATAQDTPLPPDPVPAEQAGKPSVKKLDDTRFQVGEIIFDSKTREIQFPAEVNMTEGALEFLVVHRNGKVHESLFSTTISATHLNLAFTLLHYQPSKELVPVVSDTGGASEKYTQVPAAVKAAARVMIQVEWNDDGKTRKVPASEWIQHGVKTTAMPAGPWVYGGSDFYDGKFSAETSGDIASIHLAPSALISYPGVDFLNDNVWTPFPKRVPPVGTKVTIRIAPNSPTKAIPKP